MCRTDLLHAVADDGTDGVLQHFKLLINHVRPQMNEEVQQVGGAAEVVGGNGLGHLVLLHCLSQRQNLDSDKKAKMVPKTQWCR